jgi:tetratricopeptide (TPR) repeat protein
MSRSWRGILAVLVGVCFSAPVHAGSTLDQEAGWTQARRSLAEGKAGEAKDAFEELLAKYPREPDLYLFLGISHLRLRNPDAAMMAINKAIDLDPKHIEALTLLGWIDLEIRGNVESAIEQYKKVVELKPDSPQAYVNLGVAYKHKGTLQEALKSYNQALVLKGDYVEALSNRGWLLIEQEKWPQARRDFDEALKIKPDDQGALQGLAQVLEKSRDYAGAQQVLSRLNAQSPNFVYWLQWGRIGLIRYWWVGVLVAVALFAKSRFTKARVRVHG